MRLNNSMMLGAVLVLAACGGNSGNSQTDDTEYAEATPDLSGVSLEINPSTTVDESALTGADFSQVYAQAVSSGAPSEFLNGARVEVKALNSSLKDTINKIVSLSNGGVKVKAGDVFTYGPADVDGANFRLAVKKTSDKHFSWKLEARAQGSTDDSAFKLVGAGRLVRGTQAHRGRGVLGLNLDNLKAAAPTTTGAGKLMAAYAHTAGDDKTLAYKLVGFTPNTTTKDPVTGAFVGYKLADSHITALRVFGKYNLADSATTAKENVFARLRFIPGTGGRADILATGGDIATGHVYIGASCWDKDEGEVFKVLRDCTRASTGAVGTCTVVKKTGAATDCTDVSFRDDGTSGAPTDDTGNTTQEPNAPSDTDATPDDVTADF